MSAQETRTTTHRSRNANEAKDSAQKTRTSYQPRKINEADESDVVRFGDLREEFATLDTHLKSQFESQYQFHKDINTQMKTLIEETRQELKRDIRNMDVRISTLVSLQRNRLASRAFHNIWPLPTKEGSIPRLLPRTIATFWQLVEPTNMPKLTSLLNSYVYTDFEIWEQYNDDGESIELPTTQLRMIPSHTTPLEYYVEKFPQKAHRTLAEILGLEYSVIKDEMEKLRRYRARAAEPASGVKREHGMYGETSLGRSLKNARAIASDESSLTEEIHIGPRGNYKQTVLSTTSGQASQETGESSARDSPPFE